MHIAPALSWLSILFRVVNGASGGRWGRILFSVEAERTDCWRYLFLVGVLSVDGKLKVGCSAGLERGTVSIYLG